MKKLFALALLSTLGIYTLESTTFQSLKALNMGKSNVPSEEQLAPHAGGAVYETLMHEGRIFG